MAFTWAGYLWRSGGVGWVYFCQSFSGDKMNDNDPYECMNCELTIDPEDTFEATDEETLEHYNCPACFYCSRILGIERYPVRGANSYGSWAPALCCKMCSKIRVPKA